MSGTFFLVTVSVPLVVGAFAAMAEVLLRDDVRPLRKAVWIVVLWVVPIVGLAAYALFRPARHARLRTVRRGAPNEAAVALVSLAEAFQRGEIDGPTYDAQVARFVPADDITSSPP
jgi:hypothetical protein